MDRKMILLAGWNTAYDQEGWYPPLKDALHGMTAAQADWKPSADAHSVRELVTHLIFYKDRFLHRLNGREWKTSFTTNEETFDHASDGWEKQESELGRIHREIQDKIETLADIDLDKALSGEPLGAQVFSLIQHDAYHTGQIVLLRKLQGSWRN